MSHDFADIDVLFIAGFGPITRSTSQSRDFYCQALGLPLKPMPGNEAYLLSEQDAIGGVKHFALWPLAQAAQSCFGQDQWPETEPVPQAWIEFEVRDLAAATARLASSSERTSAASIAALPRSWSVWRVFSSSRRWRCAAAYDCCSRICCHAARRAAYSAA